MQQERAYESDPNFLTDTRGAQPGGAQSSSVDARTLTVLDLIRFTRVVTQCTAQVMRTSTSGKQDDLIALANSSRRAIRDMLVACRAIHEQIREPTETNEQLKRRLLEVGQHASAVYKALLECLVCVVQQPTVENKTELTNASRHVSVAITDLVAVAEQLKSKSLCLCLCAFYICKCTFFTLRAPRSCFVPIFTLSRTGASWSSFVHSVVGHSRSVCIVRRFTLMQFEKRLAPDDVCARF